MSFVADLKLGHYMKIPPRTLFWTQIVATIWGSLVEVGVMNWALGNIKGICTKAAVNHFNCPQARVFFTASVVWGLLGPSRVFSIGQIYDKLLYFFLIGFFAPVPVAQHTCSHRYAISARIVVRIEFIDHHNTLRSRRIRIALPYQWLPTRGKQYPSASRESVGDCTSTHIRRTV